MVERKPGYGWRFLTGARDAATPDVVGLHVDWVRLYGRGGSP